MIELLEGVALGVAVFLLQRHRLMIAKRIARANAYPGAPKDWDPKRHGECGHLAVRVCKDVEGVVYCESAWEPTPKELEQLNAGGQIVLRVVGWQVPVALYVEPAPEETPANADS